MRTNLTATDPNAITTPRLDEAALPIDEIRHSTQLAEELARIEIAVDAQREVERQQELLSQRELARFD